MTLELPHNDTLLDWPRVTLPNISVAPAHDGRGSSEVGEVRRPHCGMFVVGDLFSGAWQGPMPARVVTTDVVIFNDRSRA